MPSGDLLRHGSYVQCRTSRRGGTPVDHEQLAVVLEDTRRLTEQVQRFLAVKNVEQQACILRSVRNSESFAEDIAKFSHDVRNSRGQRPLAGAGDHFRINVEGAQDSLDTPR